MVGAGLVCLHYLGEEGEPGPGEINRGVVKAVREGSLSGWQGEGVDGHGPREILKPLSKAWVHDKLERK